jgi:hypothetical protein
VLRRIVQGVRHRAIRVEIDQLDAPIGVSSAEAAIYRIER